MAAFGLPPDAASAIDFIGNNRIFEARVEGMGQAKKSTTEHGLTLVASPVTVVVTAVYRGDIKPGDRILLRDLGGTAPDGTKLVVEDQFPMDTWRPGTQIFAFTELPVTTSDGLSMSTPGWVFIASGGVATNANDPSQTISVENMRQQLHARWDSQPGDGHD